MWYLWIGNTPLLFAAKNGHEDIVQELIQHGADVNDKNKDSKFSFLSSCNMKIYIQHDWSVYLYISKSVNLSISVYMYLYNYRIYM